jgi:breakpoint cluster region protein
LREELEKEEFYVEYLERLLADVERHKQLANSTNANTSIPENNQQTESHSIQQDAQVLENSLADSNSPNSQSVGPSAPTLTDREDSKFQDKCVSELSSTLSTASKRPKSEIPRSSEKVPELRRNSDPDVPSNYITVIEVTGNSKKDKNESLKEEDEKGILYDLININNFFH